MVYNEKFQLFIEDLGRTDKTVPKNIFITQNMPIGDILTYHFIYKNRFSNLNRFQNISSTTCISIKNIKPL